MKSMRWLAGCAAALSILLVAGCGGGGSSASPATPSAASLANQLRSAMKNATSVHVAGTVTDSGQTIHLDLSLTRAGEMAGTIGLGPGPITILATGGKVYMKMTAASVKAMHLPTAACSMFCNKYLVLPPSEAQGLTGGAGWSQLLNPSMFKGTPGPDVKVTGPVTINGEQAWKLHDSTGAVAYVAAHGPAYPLRIISPKGQAAGQIDFTQWNSVTIPGPPPKGEQVDLSKLGA